MLQRVSRMIAIAVMIAACGGQSKPETTSGGSESAAAATTKPLYDRLGGRDAIVAVVDEFIANVVADNRINAFFANADVPKLKTMLVDQICEAAGGPCKYTGRSMKETHTGMGVKG